MAINDHSALTEALDQLQIIEADKTRSESDCYSCIEAMQLTIRYLKRKHMHPAVILAAAMEIQSEVTKDYTKLN